MQGHSAWSPPGGTLGAIVEQTTQRVLALHARRGELESALAGLSAPPAFGAALRGASVRVIAEVKRRSPSRGAINAAMDAPAQADAYATGGAAAISVLTEPAHFGGSPADLTAVRQRVGARVPVLKKDFHIDEIQLVEARALGAAAALLIVRALPPGDLLRLTAYARRIGLETLVEVHSDDELARALDAGADVIGVNSRDLETLEVDPAVPERLVARIPRAMVAVWESGVSAPSDVERAAAFGADAVLVGSALSSSGTPAAAVRALAGVARRDGVRA
ncbi:MAG: indole-3-glycerol-phosphate synthase [Gemmatimonadota bacterium]|nr:indole-3-glycerol-phosphate synthase [Gemmatimonadota bacterium]MDE3171849.1 indole-3-glycerol-phosphate synthase [Gemmatimonadota bacterium]MDE3214799.1 indole-3-glycerol-phosphate synthase [Gemmatimonadota bacterium]